MTKIITKALLGACAFLALDSVAHADLFVSSYFTAQVLRYDGSTGAFKSVFVTAASGGLNGPRGLTFGPDGNLYVASGITNQVLRYNGSTGAFLGVFVTAGSGGLNGPYDLTFGPDGSLYVASNGSNQVLRYDGSTGAFQSVFVTAGSGGLSGPVGLTFGPDGNLYVASNFTNQVMKYNGSTGAFQSVFVTAGSGGLASPYGLTFGPDGNLYVASLTGNQVLSYNGSTGAFLSAFVTPGSGGLSGATGLVFGPDSNLYVGSFNNSEVLKYNGSTGNFQSVFVTTGSGGLGAWPPFLVFSPTIRTDAFQVGYAANLGPTGGESFVDITNTGASSTTTTPQNLCINVYAFDAQEELLSCCFCQVTPNGLAALNVTQDLLSNTLTGASPTSAVIKLVATAPTTGVCDPTSAGTTANPLASGMAAWGTTLHHLPGSTTGFGLTERPFTISTLSAGELSHLTTFCAFDIANGTGAGICKGCSGHGGLGASSTQ